MDLSIDKFNEYEPILDGTREITGQIAGWAPRRRLRTMRKGLGDG
jgi:hypothetical protein